MKVFKKDKGVLIYENKNNHELLTIPVSLNDNYKNWVNNAFEWMRTVRKAWVDQTIPKRNYRSNYIIVNKYIFRFILFWSICKRMNLYF